MKIVSNPWPLALRILTALIGTGVTIYRTRSAPIMRWP
jgi:hypothetical protein